MKRSLILLATLFVAVAARAQERDGKAWEIGLGGSVLQFNRFGVGNFTTTDDGHHINMQVRQAVFGGNLHLARELTGALAIDFQGTVGLAEDKPGIGLRGRALGMAGLGLQWRMGDYFGSRYIDPYLRVGGNYMYKGFNILYASSANGLNWNMVNNQNKEGADGRHLFAVAAGAGVNMWLNERFGIGMQGDYLIVRKRNVANSLQGTARLMWRFGAKAKGQPATPAVTSAPPAYPVEKVVEYRDVIVRDTVFIEKRVPGEGRNIHELIQDIFFDFDGAELKSEYSAIVGSIASIMKRDTSRRYLLTGYTDIRGNPAYNEKLSLRRAEAIRDALLGLGVPGDMLKVRGVGSKVSHAAYGESAKTREGDRKITVELITNQEYWEIL